MSTHTVEVENLLAAATAAAPQLAAMAPCERATALVSVADALDAAGDEIVAIGRTETGLAEVRLRGELRRTTSQLRLFAEVVVEGAYLDARIDEADPDYVVGPRPDVRRVKVPVGPVLNFAASNFPLAFSVAGGDSAAALAAGNPLIVKTHDGHRELGALTAGIVSRALNDAAMPEGTFATVHGREASVAVLQDERVRAASFTGSTTVGLHLAGLAASRPTPIPFYGELGSVNPVFASAAAVDHDPAGFGAAFTASVAGSCGQLCTKPGFLFVPSADQIVDSIGAAAGAVGPHQQLTASITRGYAARRQAVLATAGVDVVVRGDVTIDDHEIGHATPTIVRCTLETLHRERESLLEESFGPLSVVVEYGHATARELAHAAAELFPGNLTATAHLEVDVDLPTWSPLLETLSRTSGRVLFGGWPTGVSVTPAMQHGGPHPATTTDATSVGTAAIERFLRAVAFQDAPQAALPAPLQDINPWDVPQRRSPAGRSSQWGSLSGRY